MMSADPAPAAAPTKSASSKDEIHGTSAAGNRKNSSASRPAPEQQSLKCPRCDSPNTKFCYYNNYSLTQPRHFCKTCRRYWTKGGALRNVPVGGGCRKNKKVKSSSSRLSGSGSGADSKDYSSSPSTSDFGLKFFHGISPAMDFQLSGLSFPRVLHHNPSSAHGLIYNSNSNNTNTFGDVIVSPNTTSFDNNSINHLSGTSSSSNPLMMSSFSNYNPLSLGPGGFSAPAVHTNLASSIESLSSINQDLHWKLQQQRLATMLFGGDQTHQKDETLVNSNNNNDNDDNNNNNNNNPEKQPHQSSSSVPLLFHNLEISRQEDHHHQPPRKDQVVISTGNDSATATGMEWFFGNSNYGQPQQPPVVPQLQFQVSTVTPSNSGSTNNIGHDHQNGNTTTWINSSNGNQTWSTSDHFAAI
ncbi:hypothetical protein CsatB_023991 [Cannabis sativa]